MRRMPWGAPVHYGVDDVAGNKNKCKRADEYQRARMDISFHNEVGENISPYVMTFIEQQGARVPLVAISVACSERCGRWRCANVFMTKQVENL
jgi:hypothetical protein